MAEAVMSFSIIKPVHTTKLEIHPSSSISLRQGTSVKLYRCWLSSEGKKVERGCFCKVNALPDLHLMAVLVQQLEGQRDIITNKSIWHLSDQAIKNVYTFYIMFTCWGCMFFGSTKDPYYDSEAYRKDGGDGTGHWVYDKQEDIEESARAELWREELIEEIEQKVGGLRELEEAGRK
ncbi:photosynthetic NDH subunit of subcomplex B 4, chloroplastic [Carica papaya]|uniref:photosynthetic NDH subunit of subcomplex B 4, chloroplastic n=1 Tax=Carica papaya TaxID=3649 RepID=UPI000B8C9536|nr:photosynthetic NDH subunit of subcomplex B 4, chloroplastic [Carica papaya]